MHHPSLLRARPLALALAVMTPWTATAQSGAASPAAAPVMAAAPCGRVDIAPVVQIPVGKSTVIKPANAVTRILLGNPERARAARPAEKEDGKSRRDEEDSDVDNRMRPGVADVDVLLLSPNEIYLLGKTIGSTNVVMLDRSGACTAFDVVVGMDTTALQTVLQQLMPAEQGVKVSSAFDSIVLSGNVSDPGALVRVTDLANAFVRGQTGSSTARMTRVVNMLSVSAPQQVMLEVKVAEVSKAVLDRFGINFARAYAPGDGSMMRFLSGIFGGGGLVAGQVSGTVGARVGGGIIGSTSNGAATGALTGPIGNATIGGDSTTIPLIAGTGSTSIGMDAQKNDGLVKILAEPTVMAISGQTGSFLAGGKIFIPVERSGVSGTSVSLEEKEFGVSVKFTPTVLEGGRINLQVRPEVSELNREGVGIAAPGISGLAILPSFTTRKAETTVQLLDGQSFAIGGLLKNNTTTNVRAFPFLGELPIIGALFRSTEFQTDRSELVFVITPRLVKPLPPDYALPTDGYIPPSRSDLILYGRTEGRPTSPADAATAPPTPSEPAPARSGGFETR
jgi:pilus assembly protein CpaC